MDGLGRSLQEKERNRIIMRFIENGVSYEIIAKATDLTIEEVRNIEAESLSLT